MKNHQSKIEDGQIGEDPFRCACGLAWEHTGKHARSGECKHGTDLAYFCEECDGAKITKGIDLDNLIKEYEAVLPVCFCEDADRTEKEIIECLIEVAKVSKENSIKFIREKFESLV